MAEQTPSSSPRYRIAVCAIMSTALALFFLVPTIMIHDLVRKVFPKLLYTAYWFIFFLALVALTTAVEYFEPRFQNLLKRFRTTSKKQTGEPTS